MKKFTDTQKKWALTATMIAALGCSVSFNSQTNGMASLDLASEGVTGTVEVEKNKIINLRIKSTTDSQTIVEQSPAKDAEGKATFECNDCKTFIVPQPLGDGEEMLKAVSKAIKQKWSQNSIENAVAKAIDLRDDKDEERAPETKESEEISERQRERDERREEARLEREEKKAEQKREKDEYKNDMARLKKAAADADCKEFRNKGEKMQCLTQAYLSTLEEEIDFKVKDDKGRTVTESRPVNSSAAFDYFVKTIEPSLRSDIKRGASPAFHNFLASIPPDFNNVREQVLSGTKTSYYEAAVEYRNSIVRAKTTQSPVDKRIALENKTYMLGLYDNLLSTNRSALFEASRRGNIEPGEMKDVFDRSFYRGASSIHDISSRWITFDQRNQAIVNLDSYPLPTSISGSLDDLDFNSSLPPGVLPAPGSSRTTNARSAISSSGTLVSPSADEVLDGTAQPAIVVIQQGDSEGFQVGQPRTLTNEARAEADRRNLLQGQRF